MKTVKMFFMDSYPKETYKSLLYKMLLLMEAEGEGHNISTRYLEKKYGIKIKLF